MMRDHGFGNAPKVFQIFYGEVASLQSYGAFIRIPGCRKQGLVHISQMSNGRVEDPSEMVAKGDRVYCKVIAMEGDAQKISLSMKVVNQANGQDLDPNNVQSSQDEKKRRQWNPRSSRRIELGAELNTTCRRCGGHGHLAMDCFVSRGDNRYGLIPDLSEHTSDRSHKKHKKDKKKKKKQKTKKRQSSSSSSSESEDSGSEDDRRKKPNREVSTGHSSRRNQIRQDSDSDSGPDRDQVGKGQGGAWEKHGSRDRRRETSKREKDDSRRRPDHSDSEGDSEPKGESHRKMARPSYDYQQSNYRPWQQEGGRGNGGRGGGGRDTMRNTNFDRPTSRREPDFPSNRREDRSLDHRGDTGRKRNRSESSSEEEDDRQKEKRGGGYGQKYDSGRYAETGRKGDSFDSKDRRSAVSSSNRDSERHRRDKY